VTPIPLRALIPSWFGPVQLASSPLRATVPTKATCGAAQAHSTEADASWSPTCVRVRATLPDERQPSSKNCSHAILVLDSCASQPPMRPHMPQLALARKHGPGHTHTSRESAPAPPRLPEKRHSTSRRTAPTPAILVTRSAGTQLTHNPGRRTPRTNASVPLTLPPCHIDVAADHIRARTSRTHLDQGVHGVFVLYEAPAPTLFQGTVSQPEYMHVWRRVCLLQMGSQTVLPARTVANELARKSMSAFGVSEIGVRNQLTSTCRGDLTRTSAPTWLQRR